MTGSQQRKSKEATWSPGHIPLCPRFWTPGQWCPRQARQKEFRVPRGVCKKLYRALSFMSQIPDNCTARSREN